jgi:hypothetical protein
MVDAVVPIAPVPLPASTGSRRAEHSHRQHPQHTHEANDLGFVHGRLLEGCGELL